MSLVPLFVGVLVTVFALGSPEHLSAERARVLVVRSAAFGLGAGFFTGAVLLFVS